MLSSRMVIAQVLGIVVSVAVVASAVEAQVTVYQKCQKAKILARGKWKDCRAVQRAKVAVGGTADLAKCDDKLAAKLVKAEQGITVDALFVCRFVDNNDETVSDLDTGLMWEKKNSDNGVANYANPHDVDNTYDILEATGNIVGFRFLGLLNGETFDAAYDQPGFAGYRDWRLPSIGELQSIVDTSVLYLGFVPCGSMDDTPCIQKSAFGPPACASPFTPTSAGITRRPSIGGRVRVFRPISSSILVLGVPGSRWAIPISYAPFVAAESERRLTTSSSAAWIT